MSLTVSQLANTVFGNKRAILATVTFDSSYPTGGESLTAADLGLQKIEALFVDAAAAAAGSTASVVKYDKTNSKLQAFGAAAASTHTHTSAAHTHAAGAITVDSHSHTSGAITVGSHLHVENADVVYTQNANTAGTVATASAAATAGTVATAAGATSGSTTPGATGAGGAISAGAANFGEVADTTNLSALSCVILALGV